MEGKDLRDVAFAQAHPARSGALRRGVFRRAHARAGVRDVVVSPGSRSRPPLSMVAYEASKRYGRTAPSVPDVDDAARPSSVWASPRRRVARCAHPLSGTARQLLSSGHGGRGVARRLSSFLGDRPLRLQLGALHLRPDEGFRRQRSRFLPGPGAVRLPTAVWRMCARSVREALIAAAPVPGRRARST